MESISGGFDTEIVWPQGPDRGEYPHRFFLELAYKGSAWHGWQRQENVPNTIQQKLEEVLSQLLRHPAETVACGRTDAGVHASQQFVHLDTRHPLLEDPRWIERFNSLLPVDINIASIRPVQHQAHARFSCTSRSYIYKLNRLKDPFLQQLSYYFPYPLRPELMQEAAQVLLRHRHFKSLSKVHTTTKTFICHIKEARWEELPGGQLEFHITADRFLRGMVRTIVGSLLDVGRGRIDSGGFEAMITAQDRRAAGRAVPPDGLYLCRGTYPDDIWLPGVQLPQVRDRGRYHG